MLLIRDPAARRRKEAENGSRQFGETLRLVGEMGDALDLTPGIVRELNRLAIDGVHSTAGGGADRRAGGRSLCSLKRIVLRGLGGMNRFPY